MTGARVAIRTSLSAADVAALGDGRLMALRIPDFAAASACLQVADSVLVRPDLGGYGNIRSARRLGMVFYETMTGPEAEAAYFAAVPDTIRSVRTLFHPLLSPIDRLRLELDEVWPGGAMVARMRGAGMLAGTIRVFDGESEVEPHVDFVPDDAPDEPWCRALTGQIAANIYLRPADLGGELELWDFRPGLDWQERMEIPGGYGFPRAALPAASVRLAPAAGELILFDSRNVHSVGAVTGARVALSCFVGCSGPDRPLMIWS